MERETDYALKQKLELLASKKGRHTELITVYVPAGHDLNKAISRLIQEEGTAENIKSKATRKNVVAALEKIVAELRLFKKLPEKGLGLFCGNVSEKEGQTDFLLETIIPPKPLSVNLYRCSQKFVLEPLEEMVESEEIYGIIVIDRREANIAFLKGKRIEELAKLDSMVPGKFRAGGQSAQRFERVIEGMANDFYKKVGETATAKFLHTEGLKGIIVGGPGHTKNDFLAAEYIPNELMKKVIGIVDIGYTGTSGIEELVNKSHEILKEAEITKEKQILGKFLELLGKDTGLASYGEANVRRALNAGAVETLLISEKIKSKYYLMSCLSCDHEEEHIGNDSPELTCKVCGSAMELSKEQDLVENLIEISKSMGSNYHIISAITQEGQQLYHLGGIAAILRFKVQKQ